MAVTIGLGSAAIAVNLGLSTTDPPATDPVTTVSPTAAATTEVGTVAVPVPSGTVQTRSGAGA
ncbi:MAG: hypothetical protein ACKV2O_14150 [Acidimicrobiales bacterium]